eukprot:TRINITY_DN2487_c0_g1_i4.p1 TRINITY_DN2487_c0_g1~~TRINITY_DN2487_c0_g1_i4.p1  ORF type:complete len:271 (-),score=51.86 TRINITY_DN2487_c0_g1_i4:30-842(-)
MCRQSFVGELHFMHCCVFGYMVFFFFFSSRRRHTRCREVSWARRCVQETALKIAQITDMHLGAVYSPKYLKKVVDEAALLDPDFLVITGDLFDGSMPVSLSPSIFDNFHKPIYYILGNHESFYGIDKALQEIKKIPNIVILRNTMLKLDSINLIGVDHSRGQDQLFRELSSINPPAGEVNVLLFHAPIRDLSKLEHNHNISVMLAGHTHGGQSFPFNVIQKIRGHFISGVYSSSSGFTKMYVCNGVGTAGPPMRIGTKSQLGFITLRPLY